MNKKQIAKTLGIMCFILTFAISVQIRTMNNANSTASQTLSDNELRDNVLRWKERYDNLSKDLEEAEKKLEKVRQMATKNDTTASAKEEQLKINNTLLGLTNVKGSGIVIEMEDGKIENSILDNRYSDYFGFTNEEVQTMLDYYGASEKYGEFREWDGGYSLREKEIFNPRSVVERLCNEEL